MTLLAPKVEEIYPIGSVIEANYPPSDNWLLCQGQVLSQSDYSALYAMMDNPHPFLYSHWNFCDDYDTGGDYPYSERVQWNGSTGSPIWVAAADSGKYSRSTDGITWSLGNFPSTGQWYGPAWNGTVFCAVKYGSNAAATSTDGSSWTARTLNTSSNWRSIVWDGTNFIAISTNSNQPIKSTDGITWSNTTGTLPETGFYYAASNGSGDIVACDSSNDIVYSANGGTSWTKAEGGYGPWNSIEYCNGKFLIATERSYVGVSEDDGVTWEWIPYASDSREAFGNMGLNAAQITRWRYWDSIYFGVASVHAIGVYSFDLRTFHPWFCNPTFQEQYDVVYNSSSGNLTVFGGYGYAMNYTSKIEDYNESTHFQLPSYFHSRSWDRGKHRYIRVK